MSLPEDEPEPGPHDECAREIAKLSAIVDAVADLDAEVSLDCDGVYQCFFCREKKHTVDCLWLRATLSKAERTL